MKYRIGVHVSAVIDVPDAFDANVITNAMRDKILRQFPATEVSAQFPYAIPPESNLQISTQRLRVVLELVKDKG